ncbi:flagellar basal body rod protein FlgC [Candidatus Epulonipiscium fishelsonii]|uniref:Flagellar basal body rod protein FlgC n=1 Tax=Candidatus Epulonipiscium fishelsonii TaxID=77094 RepID=A0ACC8XDN7_9FIRM|nr:flagellar basal body rod protein FlgC [Epulopiscium sp. SCG-B05WGA-EpuloA1]ONI40974.1 flagellar basal body rod protein FlgC [Epulopiscium sp. SCG-B11WGA-EpuloA1]ONI47326.1 flagellar basal body rod protein FlgC [Epulopiscium sp. SCG-C06WGA-EpuloA1]
MSFFDGMNIAATGLTAQRQRLDIISQNLANVETTRTPEGGPYQRKVVTFEQMNPDVNFNTILNDTMGATQQGVKGVRVASILEDTSPFPVIYDPGHPDANADGYVTMPNVNSVDEMVNMISASRSYEANVTVFNNMKAMIAKALELGK